MKATAAMNKDINVKAMVLNRLGIALSLKGGGGTSGVPMYLVLLKS